MTYSAQAGTPPAPLRTSCMPSFSMTRRDLVLARSVNAETRTKPSAFEAVGKTGARSLGCVPLAPRAAAQMPADLDAGLMSQKSDIADEPLRAALNESPHAEAVRLLVSHVGRDEIARLRQRGEPAAGEPHDGAIAVYRVKRLAVGQRLGSHREALGAEQPWPHGWILTHAASFAPALAAFAPVARRGSWCDAESQSTFRCGTTASTTASGQGTPAAGTRFASRRVDTRAWSVNGLRIARQRARRPWRRAPTAAAGMSSLRRAPGSSLA